MSEKKNKGKTKWPPDIDLRRATTTTGEVIMVCFITVYYSKCSRNQSEPKKEGDTLLEEEEEEEDIGRCEPNSQAMPHDAESQNRDVCVYCSNF